MKRIVLIGLSVLLLVSGIGIMLYPLISNYLYERQQQELITYYEELEEEMPDEERQQELKACRAYNAQLLGQQGDLKDPFDSEQNSDFDYGTYESLLNLDQDGIMGALEIPALQVSMMIYHGVSDSIMQAGAGHMPQSSLPVGGKGTHAVLSSHSGLSRKKLFTDLDQLEEGDVFYIHVLGEVLAYQVDKIQTVLPTQTEEIAIDPNEDYVTLLTCTPYGVNSHRLLVRGTRIPYEEVQKQPVKVKSGSHWTEEYIHYIVLGIAIAAGVILLVTLLHIFRRRRNKKVENQN